MIFVDYSLNLYNISILRFVQNMELKKDQLQ